MKNKLLEIVKAILLALSRARIAILTVGLTYLISVVVGMVMVHAGNRFAIDYRDKLVSGAQSSPILVALDRNNRLQAALLDTGGNLFGAVGNTLGGLGVVFPYPFIAYRGWIGGIVSIDGAHVSRLADPQEAFYYLSTLILQLIPSILAAGAGVNLGLSFYRPKPYYQGRKWLGVSVDAIRDVLWIYMLVIPLLLLASLWEFGMR
ncbi:MAG: stage II sporulation protein M [Anaerolineales bacterium]